MCVEFDLNPDDIALEGDEQFNVMITAVSNGGEIGSPSTSSVTIIDDDGKMSFYSSSVIIIITVIIIQFQEFHLNRTCTTAEKE